MKIEFNFNEFRPVDKFETFTELPIKGIYELNRPRRQDSRGYFQEVAVFPEVERLTGVNFAGGQWNESFSNPGVIRGIHAERQFKIIRPVAGKIFIALVDLRPRSETFGDHIELEFDATHDSRSFLLPVGVGNSLCASGDTSVKYQYVVSTTYDPREKPMTIRYDDEDIGIRWPIPNPTVSERDGLLAATLRETFPDKFS